jgi:hypothetical protein
LAGAGAKMKIAYKAAALIMPFLLLISPVFAEDGGSLSSFFNETWLIVVVVGFIVGGAVIERKVKGIFGFLSLLVLTILSIMLGYAIPIEYQTVLMVWFIVPLSLGVLAVYSLLDKG